MRQIKLKELELTEFKNHKSLTVTFGILNVIKGINGAGKSSIGDAVSWGLFGNDMLGNRLDPSPTDRDFEKVKVKILIEIDGKQIMIGREQPKDKPTEFYINEVPKKAKEFDETLGSIFNKDLFLSLFNPSYFPSLHWTKQREMILSYTTAPANSEVYKKLPQLQADKLKAEFKKNNIDDLESIHKKNKTNKEKELIAAKSRVDTLEGQLEGVEPQELAFLKVDLEDIEEALKAAHEHNRKQANQTTEYITKEREVRHLFDKIESIKEENAKSKAQDTCLSCGQTVTEETKSKIRDELNVVYKATVKRYKELQEGLAKMEVASAVDIGELVARRSELLQAFSAEQNRLKAVETIEAAKQAVTDVQQSLNDSIFILDSIKAYKGKEAELQAEKVQELFTTLSIRLWDEPKSGDKKPAFEIEMDGKPYSKLSLGEKARAGFELISVLYKQSDVKTPVFIDNAEGITGAFETDLQTIRAYAVSNQKLEVITQ